MAPSQQQHFGSLATSLSGQAERHLGDLARSDGGWSVYLETRLDPAGGPRGRASVAGRLHFVDGPRRLSTAWIFLAESDQDIVSRFNEFSPTELWRLAESLGTG
jgi:hypothetical protein